MGNIFPHFLIYNIMKIILRIFTLFTFVFAVSQDIHVAFNVIDPIDNLSESPFQGELLHNQNSSIYTNYRKELDINTLYEENGQINGIKVEFKEEFFKDFLNSSIYSYANMPFARKKILKDNLNLFEWKIQKDIRKTIIGYECIQATTHFRGRDYIAFFTPDINISDGPWKFNGLPGLILEVKEVNNRIHYIAKELNFINNPNIATSFDLSNSMTLNELLIFSKERFEQKKKELDTKYGGDISFSDNGIELLNLH